MNRWDSIKCLARDIASNVHQDPEARDAMADDLIRLCGEMIAAVGKGVAISGEVAMYDNEDGDPADSARALVGDDVQREAATVVSEAIGADVERYQRDAALAPVWTHTDRRPDALRVQPDLTECNFCGEDRVPPNGICLGCGGDNPQREDTDTDMGRSVGRCRECGRSVGHKLDCGTGRARPLKTVTHAARAAGKTRLRLGQCEHCGRYAVRDDGPCSWCGQAAVKDPCNGVHGWVSARDELDEPLDWRICGVCGVCHPSDHVPGEDADALGGHVTVAVTCGRCAREIPSCRRPEGPCTMSHNAICHFHH